jgi:iron complex transport system substrate-binding protein
MRLVCSWGWVFFVTLQRMEGFYILPLFTNQWEGFFMLKRTLTLIVALCLALTLCASAEIQSTDMLGRAHTFQAPATRVVALSAAECEILFALNAGSTLVGRGEYCDYPEAALPTPVLGSGGETNIEEILALKPDLVLMNSMAQPLEQVEAIEKAGIPVFVTQATDIAGVYAAISGIGQAVGKDQEAQALVDGMKAAFDSLKSKINAGSAPKTVYFEVSPLEYGLWTAGKNTFMNELADMLGLKNIFDDVDGWAEVSQEQVIARNPDMIVTVTMYFGDGPKPDEEIKSRAGWEGITAVKEGKILTADNNAMTRPGPRLADAAQSLYDFAYGN